MNPRNSSRLGISYGFLGLLLASMVSTAALAESPSRHGFPPSLHQLNEAAELTAFFNVGPRTANTYPPDLPFQILYTPYDPNGVNNTGGTYTTFYVKPGTRLYVPVIYNDNSIPIIGDFPPAGDRAALLHYIFSQEQLGLVYATITIDGQVTTLGPRYVVEVAFDSPLPDGATLYQAVAAVLTPLKKGTHTVEISALATGAALREDPFPLYFPDGVFEFSSTYTVIVQ